MTRSGNRQSMQFEGVGTISVSRIDGQVRWEFDDGHGVSRGLLTPVDTHPTSEFGNKNFLSGHGNTIASSAAVGVAFEVV